MNREQVIAKWSEHMAELRSMGVGSLDLFGSVARDEAEPGSDVDILVQFSRPVGLFQFFRVQHRIEEILGVERVDLVEQGAVHPALKGRISAEAVHVALALLPMLHHSSFIMGGIKDTHVTTTCSASCGQHDPT